MAHEVWRTEVMETKAHPPLHQLCFQTKNLYNRAMFLFKQYYYQTKKYLSYQQLDRKLKKEECYKILPAHTAQHTLKLLTRNWKSFRQARKEYKVHPQVFLAKPRPPKYKAKNGQQIAIFTNQQVRIEGRKLIFPRKVLFSIKTRLIETTKVKEVRIIPRALGYTIEIVYTKLVPNAEVSGKNIGAIDLGITNLITYVDNINSRPIVVKDEGKGIKSIIQFYLKEGKKIQQKYAQQQGKQLKQQNNLVYGSRFHKIRETKRKKVRNWIHQMGKQFVDYWVEKGIQRVIIGYNP